MICAHSQYLRLHNLECKGDIEIHRTSVMWVVLLFVIPGILGLYLDPENGYRDRNIPVFPTPYEQVPVKVKSALEQTIKTQTGSRGTDIAVVFL